MFLIIARSLSEVLIRCAIEQIKMYVHHIARGKDTNNYGNGKVNKEKKLCKSRIFCKFAPNNIIAVKFIAVKFIAIKFYEEIL